MLDPSDRKKVSCGVEDGKHRDDEVQAFFEQLFLDMGKMLQAQAFRLLGDWHQAEDAVQEAFCVALKREESNHSVLIHLNIEGFMVRVVQNTVRNMRHRQQSAQAFLNELQALAVERMRDVGPEYSLVELKDICQKVLSRQEYEVLEEIILNNGSYSELSRRTGVDPGTLRKRLQRALKKLRENMEEAH